MLRMMMSRAEKGDDVEKDDVQEEEYQSVEDGDVEEEDQSQDRDPHFVRACAVEPLYA